MSFAQWGVGPRVAVAAANDAMRVGSRRRLKIEPTKSTSGSRRPAPGARWVTPGGITRTRSAGTDSRSRISRRENSESVKTTSAARAACLVRSRRLAPSRGRNQSGRAANDTSWIVTASGTPSARGAV